MNDFVAIALQVIAYGLIFLSAYLYMKYKPRAARLESTELVEIVLRIEGLHVLPIRVYLPNKIFVKNLTAALPSHVKTIRAAWSYDKEDVKKTWLQMPDSRKNDFLTTLSSELTQSLECYSPKGDLSSILCPTLKSKNLGGVDAAGSGEPSICILFDFITSEDAMKDLEVYPLMEVVSAKVIDEAAEALKAIGKIPIESLKDTTVGSSGSDTAASDKEDDVAKSSEKTDTTPDNSTMQKEKAEESRQFLQSLKILCYYLYARQFLSRVTEHSQAESVIYKIAKQSARSAVVALFAGCSAWLLHLFWTNHVYDYTSDNNAKLEL
jgi:hypothetical protein